MTDFDRQESEFAQRMVQVPFDDAPRGAHQDALREQALVAYDAARGKERTAGRLLRAIQHGRRIMRRPISRVVAASAALVVIAAVWIFAPGGQSTAQAFNKFASAIVSAKSASFQMELNIEGQPKYTATCYYLAPGQFRNEIKGVAPIGPTITIANFERRRFLTLLPDQKRAVVMNLKNVPEDADKQKTMDLFGRLRELLAEGLATKQGEYESLGEKVIDGRRAVGFRGSSALAAVTMWGDPATGMPLLVRTVYSGVPRTETTMSDFQLDVDLKPDLFNTTPPADYTVQTFDADASKFTEADLLKAFCLISEMNDGQFLDALDTASMMQAMFKRVLAGDQEEDKQQDKKKNQQKEVTQEMMQLGMTVGRGIGFALELPESAEAHYAGKGVKFGESDRPIFWYKPDGEQQYRVIHADLTVKEQSKAPDVAGAVRLEKTSDNKSPAAKQ